MTPAARVQAAIDLLDAIIAAARREGAPADRLIAQWVRANRYAGSKDRRAVRELVYRAIRACGEIPASGRAAMLCIAQEDEELRASFDGSRYGPAPIAPDERAAKPGAVPQWLAERLQASGLSGGEIHALQDRAPLDVRVNSLKTQRDRLELPLEGEALAAPHGLRLASGTPVERWPQYANGEIEVQDHGSQLACEAAAASPGETVVDLCAGAGGKTLALAAAMENRGRLVACDIDRARLARLAPRAERAGARAIEARLLDPGKELAALADCRGAADLVVVDAPCSGIGTLRRKPEAKWRINPDRLERFAQVQDRLLDIAAQLTRPGGRICFVTCSLLDEEGLDRAEAFLARHKGWHSLQSTMPLGRPRGAGMRLTPYHDGTDGFFIAMMGSAC